jgi:hypothetical protein
VSNSFWNTQTSGQATSDGGTGKTTENMENVRTYTDTTWSVGLTTPWDFVGNPYYDENNEDIWDIHPAVNDGYPFLTALMEAPSFGYSTKGASGDRNDDLKIQGSKFTCPLNGTADRIVVYIDAEQADGNFKCAIYDSDLNLVPNGSTEERYLYDERGWYTFNFDPNSKPSLSGDADYWLVVWSDVGKQSSNYFYDTGSTNQGMVKALPYDSFPSTITDPTYNDRKYSIYCTYTYIPPPYAVDVSISPSHQSAPPGGSLTYTVTVTNVGLNIDNYTLLPWNDLSWDMELANDRLLNVTSDQIRTTTLTVTIPPDAVLGTVDPITVTATGDATGVWDYASCTASVVDTTLPPVPQLISPVNGATLNDNTPTFQWSSVTDPSGVTYTLQYSDDNAFQTATTVENLFDNTYTVLDNEALADNTYYWRVQAVDGAGNQSGWSDVWQFTIGTTPPPAPTLISPPNNSRLGENTPTFRWTAVSDPSGVTYSIQVDNDPSFSSPEVNVTGLVNNTYHSPTLAYKTYSWRVRAIDGANNVGDWSAVWRVTLIPKVEPPEVEPPDINIMPDWS